MRNPTKNPSNFARAAIALILGMLMAVTGVVASASAATTRVLSGHIYLGSTALSAAAGEVKVTAVAWGAGGSPTPVEALTDASGDYSMSLTSAGATAQYTLTFTYLGSGGFSGVQWPNRPVGGSGISTITVTAADRTGVDVTLLPLATVSGHVDLIPGHVSVGAGDVQITYKRNNGTESAPVYTDANGDFEFTDLPSGDYFFRYVYLASSDYNEKPFTSPGTNVPVAIIGGDLVRPTVTLYPKYSISGTVRLGAYDGSPPAGAGDVKVVLKYRARPQDPYQTLDAQAVYTDATGAYIVTGLADGHYQVNFEWAGTPGGAYKSHIVADTTSPVILYSGDSSEVVDASLVRLATVTGHVFVGDGATPADEDDVKIEIVGIGFGPIATTYTESGGAYTFSSVYSPGDIYLVYTYLGDGPFKDTDLTFAVPGNADATVPDVVMPGVGISGHVSDSSSQPIDGVDVILVQIERTGPDIGDVVDVFDTTTALDGSYQFSNLDDEDFYIVEFSKDGYAYQAWPDSGEFYSPGLITLDTGSATFIDVTMYASAAISGTVTGTGLPAGAFASGAVTAEVLVQNGLTSLWEQTGYVVTVAADGTYALTDLGPDTYRVRFAYTGSTASSHVDSTNIVVNEGDSKTYNANLTPPPSMTSSVSPKLAGVIRVGSVASITAGTYSPAPTSSTYQWYLGSTPISGATAATYPIQGADVAQMLSVEVTASRTGYLSKVIKTAAIVVAPGVLTAPIPTLSGTVKVGSTLTANAGAWTAGTTLTYQWYADNVPIGGAMASTFVPTPAEFGKKLTVTVTGTLTAYTTVAKTSAATGPAAAAAFTAAPIPTISGNPQVGQTLTAVPGAWSPAATFTYQWSADGAAIPNTNSATFTPAGYLIGRRMTVTVTGSALGYTTVAKTSAAATPIASGVYASTPDPVAAGTPAVGSTLIADTTGWDAGSTFTYKWYADDVVIPLSTGRTYVPNATQVGEAISVRVTSTTAGYPVVIRQSTPSAPVVRGSFTTAPTPTISGAAKVGSTLTAVPGAWSDGALLSYQWFANGVAIVGAEASIFKPTLAEVGTTISVRVIGSKAGYTSTPRVSAPTAVVTLSTFTTVPKPTISVVTWRVGSRLAATPGVWVPAANRTYTWLADGVPVGTGPEYYLKMSDVNLHISLQVTGSLTGYETVTIESDPGPVVWP